ncbi:MAG: hypothetical protein V5A66_03005 [Candidatus Thermoplasmatota archaeon]
MNEEAQKISKMEVQDREFSRELVEVLIGEEDADSIEEEWIPIAEAIENPDRLPFFVSEILEMEKTKELRRALVRVQINAQLKRDQALDLYKKQLFAATTIEILLFGKLRLKPRKRKRKKGKEEEAKEPGDEESIEEVEDGEGKEMEDG